MLRSPRGLALAHELQLPLVIHTREAWSETFQLLDAEGAPERTIFHCFTGGPEEARGCLERGAYVSFSGIVTFASATDVRAAAAVVPLDRLLVETDSPYLAPVPNRGRRNRPAWVPLVGAAVAELRGVPVDEVRDAVRVERRYGLRPAPACVPGPGFVAFSLYLGRAAVSAPRSGADPAIRTSRPPAAGLRQRADDRRASGDPARQPGAGRRAVAERRCGRVARRRSRHDDARVRSPRSARQRGAAVPVTSTGNGAAAPRAGGGHRQRRLHRGRYGASDLSIRGQPGILPVQRHGVGRR